MSRTISLVQSVYVASPCNVPWETMPGGDKVRHCGECKLNVYNFAALTEAQAEELILKTEGRLCGMIYRRADGTVITKDCPKGLALVRQQAVAGLARVAAVIVFAGACVFSAFGFGLNRSGTGSCGPRYDQTLQSVKRWLRTDMPGPVATGGVIAFPGSIALGPPVPPVLQQPIRVPLPGGSDSGDETRLDLEELRKIRDRLEQRWGIVVEE